ncbi:tRNA preQ1(34) S-adenosylmethionine ribosyltransferase-isomerase QueA [Atribacter laminatus]|uniref:tRNA preQ1(34) S-adenosylmethionine ribosyltransferase-isomerase QueA n=1 Tax=Atribacter laminatus TaxID=2847778 RepID=UPI0031B5763A
MLTDQFDFHLPNELIAQRPVIPRDQCRLMVINRLSQNIEHRRFFDLGLYLKPKDLVVINDSRVIPARFFTKKNPTGGKIELLFLHRRQGLWACMLNHSRRIKEGTILSLPGHPEIFWQVEEREKDWWLLRPSFPPEKEDEIFFNFGATPTPPYIKTPNVKLEEYQTIYAKQKGSVAAPTAGLHFTQLLIDTLKIQGIQFASITLHVGLGTFFPVKTPIIEEHQMHSEWYQLNRMTAEMIRETKNNGGRVIAVGTTVVRVLESVYHQHGRIVEQSGETDIFIYPGFQFQIIDAMITNFHIPRSTLFMLVCAFAGTELMKTAYQEAIEKRYRFFSFGDATFII